MTPLKDDEDQEVDYMAKMWRPETIKDSSVKIREKKCHNHACSKKGKYKAPKKRNPTTSDDYYYFCKKHVDEYIENWDYMAGFDENAFRQSKFSDPYGHRPSWQFGSREKRKKMYDKYTKQNFEDHADFFSKDKHYQETRRATTRDNKTVKACETMEIKYPFTKEEIKIQYKKMVKKKHPDLNQSNPNADIEFKELQEAYEFLTSFFI